MTIQVSVGIPASNEQNNISKVLTALLNQNTNKIAITVVLMISKKEIKELLATVEVGVSVGVSGEVKGDGTGVRLNGTFAGIVIVCVLLQPLSSPTKLNI